MPAPTRVNEMEAVWQGAGVEPAHRTVTLDKPLPGNSPTRRGVVHGVMTVTLNRLP